MSKRSVKGAKAHVHVIVPDAANRAVLDFYRTPPEGTRRLMNVEMFPGNVWEPACGDGSMAEELKRDRNSTVYSSDLADRGYGVRPFNFLTDKPPGFRIDHIVTNPPFTHVQEFVERALSYKPKKVAILARVLWLEGVARSKFFQSTPLARVWVFAGRINIPRNGEDMGKQKGMIAYAWYVWEQGHIGPPTLGWI